LHSLRTRRAKGKTAWKCQQFFEAIHSRGLLQGAAAGAVVTLVVGFNWGGWVTGGTAKDMVQRSSTTAVVAALSPICVDKFQHSAEGRHEHDRTEEGQLVPASVVHREGRWATLPGSDAANSAVAQACANMLSNLK
jgi:hypothetical protein